MGAITLGDAKTILATISVGLDASPLPEPLRSAVGAIPKVALAIVNMAEV